MLGHWGLSELPLSTVPAASGSPTYNETVAETASAADTNTTILAALGAVAETGSAADTVTGTGVFPKSVAETGTATDVQNVTLAMPAAVAESGTAVDTQTANRTTSGAIAETGAATDTQSATRTTSGAIAETASALEDTDATVTAGGTTYNEDIVEVAAAVDTVDAGAALPIMSGGGGRHYDRSYRPIDFRKKRKLIVEAVQEIIDPEPDQEPVTAREVVDALTSSSLFDGFLELERQRQDAFVRYAVQQINAAIEAAHEDDEEALLLLLD